MGQTLEIKPADVGDRLRILTLAGSENVKHRITSEAAGFDIVIADPLYALCDGGENIEDLREPLRWLRRLAVGRAACLFVHHDAKGTPSERETRDRGSGSGITGRSVDARITLTPHRADPDNTIVAGFMCRSYVTPEPTAWTFADDAYARSDLPPDVERQSDKRARQNRPKLHTYTEPALRLLADGPMQPRVFKAKLREELGLSKHTADDLVATLTAASGPARRWHTKTFPTAYFIGLPSQVDREICRES